VITDVLPGRFLKRQADGSFVPVAGKERYIKVQTDLRTGRVGRMMSKASASSMGQNEASIPSLEARNIYGSLPARVDRSTQSPRPSSAVTRTVSNGNESQMEEVSGCRDSAALAKMKLEAEFLELSKEREVLLMQNKVLKLKQDVDSLREHNRQLETGRPANEQSE
jgi:hypothetical protein